MKAYFKVRNYLLSAVFNSSQQLFFSPLLLIPHLSSAPVSPDQALQMLMEGNQRFVQGQVLHPSYSAEAKDKLLEQQNPIVAIVGCSDSRVPPELIFDRGLGELFVVRDAGNVVGPIEMDSVEFAAASLKVPLILVLGHQNCGAVKATLSGKQAHPELDNIFPSLKKP